VAGFDFSYKCPDDQTELCRNLLRRAQTIAKNLDLQFRYERDGTAWTVTVDGPLPSMQAMIPLLAAHTRPFADGFSHPANRAKRMRAAERLINAYCDAAGKTRRMIEEHADFLQGTHYSYFLDPGGATHLLGHTDEFANSLILFHIGEISASQLCEEAHTMAETLLRASVEKAVRGEAFGKLLSEARSAARLDDDEVRALSQLKDWRKHAKHRGGRVPYAAFAAELPTIIGALHKLARVIRLSHDS